MKTENPKYYFYNQSKNCFIVSKRIRGKTNFFGYFKTEEAAKLAVKLFQKYGWDKENKWKVRYEVKKQISQEAL